MTCRQFWGGGVVVAKRGVMSGTRGHKSSKSHTQLGQLILFEDGYTVNGRNTHKLSRDMIILGKGLTRRNAYIKPIVGVKWGSTS